MVAGVHRRPAGTLESVTSVTTDGASCTAVWVVRRSGAAYLEKENQRLRKIVSDLELDKSILKEALDFSGHRG